MTELRDARLRKALDAAPDAQLQPQPRTREAIRSAAHAAAQPAWKRWWPQAGGAGPRWAAAFATFVVATLVVVLWEGREVPGARPDADIVAHAPSPAPAPLPPSAPPPQLPPQAAAPPPAAMQAPAPAARPRPAPPLERQARERRAAAPPPPVLADEAPAAAEALARGADAARKQQRLETVAPEAPVAAAAAPPPASPAPAPAPPAAPAGTPGAATPQRQGAPAAPAAALRAAPTALPWSQVRIESGGRAVVVPRAQAGRLPALVTSLLASPSGDAEPGASGSLRLELGQGDEAAGVLERVGERWRWAPVREGHPARWLRPEPELAAALDEEVGRLLER